MQETNFQGNTVKLLPKFFALHKDKFVYQKISPYLVTISREPVEVKVNVTCVVVSMVDNQFGILQFNGEGGKTEKAMFSANSLYKDGYNFKGDPVKLPREIIFCFLICKKFFTSKFSFNRHVLRRIPRARQGRPLQGVHLGGRPRLVWQEALAQVLLDEGRPHLPGHAQPQPRWHRRTLGQRRHLERVHAGICTFSISTPVKNRLIITVYKLSPDPET